MRIPPCFRKLQVPATTWFLVFAIGVSSALTTRAQQRTVEAVVDAGETHAPISPYLYGYFLEHGGESVNDGIWAELLDDRKFFHPIVEKAPEPAPSSGPMRRLPLRRRTTIGAPERVVMDARQPFVGKHSPKPVLNGSEPVGFKQDGLALTAGEACVTSEALAAGIRNT